jgi:hypothetical protein
MKNAFRRVVAKDDKQGLKQLAATMHRKIQAHDAVRLLLRLVLHCMAAMAGVGVGGGVTVGWGDGRGRGSRVGGLGTAGPDTSESGGPCRQHPPALGCTPRFPPTSHTGTSKPSVFSPHCGHHCLIAALALITPDSDSETREGTWAATPDLRRLKFPGLRRATAGAQRIAWRARQAGPARGSGPEWAPKPAAHGMVARAATAVDPPTRMPPTWPGHADPVAESESRGGVRAPAGRGVKISLCAVMTLTSHNRQSDGRDHACTSPHIRYVSIGPPSARIRPG